MMSENSQQADRSGPLHSWVELGLALFVLVFGLIVIAGSLKAGIAWDFDGPKAGFFPFYIGVFIVISAVVTFVQGWVGRVPGLFAEWRQLRQVMSVVVPATIYVFIVPTVGIYVASTLLIGVFMKWLGRYGWLLTLAVSVGVPVLTFVVFERWFLVPLPKGPLEEWLGY